jgi:hypothetical protein
MDLYNDFEEVEISDVHLRDTISIAICWILLIQLISYVLWCRR